MSVQLHISMRDGVRKGERGMVSIMVTLILMLVISLIVIGFAQVTRRNQAQTLDRQLSTQAYYAAESGVNDVIKLVHTGSPVYSATDATDCSSFMTNNSLTNSTLNAGRKVAYTCLLVDASPASLLYSTIANQQMVVAPINLNGNLSSLRIQWKSTSATPTCSYNASLPPATSWNCSYALMRMDLLQVPGSLASPTVATDLANATVTKFLKPAASGSASTTGSFTAAGTRAQIVNSACSAGTCTANLNFTGGTTTYYLRLSSMYADAASIKITGTVNGGTLATFTGAQINVDSTGKAQDELRRISVRVPSNDATVPVNALQSTNQVCKTFATGTGLPAPTPTLAGLCP